MDGKHIIFGRLVDEMDTLDEMEKIDVDQNDQPIEEIRIEHVHILVAAFQEANRIPAKERVDELDTQQMNAIDGNRRKQSAHSLDIFHEVFSL